MGGELRMMNSQPYLTLKDKRVAVAGAGVTGKSVAHALVKQGAQAFFVDENVSNVEGFAVLAPSALTPEDFDALMVSPGWREDHPVITMARTHNKPILNEIDFAWSIRCEVAPDQKWIALTGTNGKTTTVEMTAHILKSAQLNAVACGNVGTTVIDSVLSEEKYDYLVLELSSFQLHWMQDAEFVSSAILNIAEDHIDWHGSFDTYARDKVSILDKSTTAILNAQDSEVVARTSAWLGRKIFFSLDTPGPGEIGLIEELLVDRAFVPDPQEAAVIAELHEITPTVPHQVANALAAAGLALTVGVAHEQIRRGLTTFTPGRHRIEKVAEHNGISWVDDSKATNPHAAAASILSFEKVVWIAGGLAKGADMNELVQRISTRLRAAIIIGEDGPLIARALHEHAPSVPQVHVNPPHDYTRGGASNSLMEEVTRSASTYAQSGDVVLLAPACASMDQFISYGDRGDRFKAAVEKVIAHG